MQSRFDDMLLGIMKETGGIKQFLELVFNVFARRTDFYVESLPGDKMGFPPGYSEQLVFEPYNRYRQEYYKKYGKKSIEEYNKKLEELKKQKEIEENNKDNLNKKIEESVIKNEIIKETKPSNISTYNGGENENYLWSQNINDVQVQINLPQKTKGKELDVQLELNYCKIYHKTLDKVLLEGNLDGTIRADDSIWTVEDGIMLILNLSKAEENIWKTIFKGDKEIDTSKVENIKNINDFDDETQGALRKIVTEQKLKQAGLPTTEEQNTMDKLKKAWNSEESPFKGQEFDKNKFTIENGNIKFKG